MAKNEKRATFHISLTIKEITEAGKKLKKTDQTA